MGLVLVRRPIFFRRLGPIPVRGLVLFLHLLLLPFLFLLQFLRLLLVLLLYLMLSPVIGPLSLHPLMILLLPLLELLPFPVLFLNQLLLIPLVSLIPPGIPSAGRSRAFASWKIAGMDCISGATPSLRPIAPLSTFGAIGWRSVGPSCLFGGDAVPEVCRSRTSCDRGPAMVHRRA